MQSVESRRTIRLYDLFLAWVVEPLITYQALLGGLIYISVLAGTPPLWLSWTVFLLPSVLRWWRYRELIKRTPFDIPIAIFCAALVVGVVVSPNKRISLGAFQTYVVCILGYYSIVVEGLRARSHWKSVVLLTFLFFLGLVVITATRQIESDMRMLPINKWFFDLGSRFPFHVQYPVNMNALGSFAGTSLPGFLAFFVLTSDLRRRVIAGMLAVFTAVGLAMTASANGLLAALAGTTFLLALWKPWLLLLYVPLCVTGLWLTMSIYYPGYSPTWLHPVPTLGARYDIWQNAAKMLQDSLFTGLGLGMFSLRFLQTHEGWFVSHSHNEFLQLLSDGGISGVLAALVAIVIAAWLTRRMLRSGRAGWETWPVLGVSTAVCFVAYLANGLFEVFSGALIWSSRYEVSGYHYIAVPVLWVIASLFAVSYMNARPRNTSRPPRPTT